jgi:hypothetical protein
MIFRDGAVKSTKRCSAKKIPTLPELPVWQSSHVWVIHWEFQDKIELVPEMTIEKLLIFL